MFLLIPISFAALVLLYAAFWRVQQFRRGAKSWDELVAKLKPNDWSTAKGLWAVYCNASILIQLADYAAEHGNDTELSENLLQSIRAEALQMRMRALIALVQHLFSIQVVQSRPSSVN